MSKTTKTEQKNTYGWEQVPQTQDYTDFKNFQIQDDPSTPNMFARQRRDFLNTFQNPLGSYTTPELREQMTRGGLEEIGQNEGQAMRERAYDKNKLELGKAGTLMAYSRPELVQTGGTGTQKQSGGFWRDLAVSAAGGAGAAATSFI